jgi:hypothetical protein
MRTALMLALLFAAALGGCRTRGAGATPVPSPGRVVREGILDNGWEARLVVECTSERCCAAVNKRGCDCRWFIEVPERARTLVIPELFQGLPALMEKMEALPKRIELLGEGRIAIERPIDVESNTATDDPKLFYLVPLGGTERGAFPVRSEYRDGRVVESRRSLIWLRRD